MNNYESSFFSFCENTAYPFYEFNDKLSKYFLDISFSYNDSIYLTRVYFYNNILKLTFNSVEYIINYTGLDDYKINLGYIRINNLPNYINEVCNLQVIDYLIHKKNSPYNIAVTAGYNCQIDIENNNVNLIPNLGQGKGVYCGIEPPSDAVYSINGVSPDENGNINFNHLYYFKIINKPNTVGCSLTIPEGRLECTRPGLPGEQGFDGPEGLKGEEGNEAPELIIEYDYCNSPYREIE